MSERLRLRLVMVNGRAGEPFGFYVIRLTEKKLHLVIRTQLTHQKQAKLPCLLQKVNKAFKISLKSYQKFVDHLFQVGPLVPGVVGQSRSPVVAERFVFFVIEELKNLV